MNNFLDISGVEVLWSKIKQLTKDIILINVTYSELVKLTGNYVPGQQYRITDYVTTTIQPNTQVATTYHQFDIIVTADDESTLNENARAIQHEGDTYFANSDLTAWEIKYCIDNDTDRFAWADTDNGKGVIYYMKDEYGNECPYDFKNIMFIRYQLEAPETSGYSEQWINQLATNISEQFINTQLSYIWGGLDKYERYWEDNWMECYSVNMGTTKAFYTFSNIIDDVVSDKSLTPYCYDNVIKEYIISNQLRLNNNVFFSTSTTSGCYSNIFGNYCHSNSFGNYCHDNSFENFCHSNSFGNVYNDNLFGNSCCSNSFGDNCQSNSFGSNCHSNSFGNSCYSNSFGNSCYSNSFGNSCYSNSFGNSCYSNSFGNSCYSNSFGNYCQSNSFGNHYQYNSFGNNCRSNSFGNSGGYNSFINNCSSNSFGNNCQSNSFGNYCRSNIFGNNCRSNSFGNNCQYNSFRMEGGTNDSLRAYCRYIHFDDGCSYNIVWNDETSSSGAQLQNININRGVIGTSSSYNSINIENIHAEYEIQVSKNSNGDIKIFCLTDIIA